MAKLNDDQIAANLEEVKTIRFQLDPDPTSLGLNSILGKLAEVQQQKSRVSAMITEAMANVAIHEIEKESAQHEHDRKFDFFMATDDEVKNQKSAEQRNTHARLKMPDHVLSLHRADIGHIKSTWYLKLLQSVYSDLDSANTNLSRQITVLQLESNFQGGAGGFNRGTVKQLNA